MRYLPEPFTSTKEPQRDPLFGILLCWPHTNDRTASHNSTEVTIPTHCQIFIGCTSFSDQARFQGLIACSKLGPVYRQPDHAMISAQQMRPRAHSDIYPNYRPQTQTALVKPQIEIATCSAKSTASSSLVPAEHPNRRRRKQTTPSDSESERVTGYFLASGKFKCSDPDCVGLRFGRQADFRRHFTNAHAAKILEFFCPVRGCERSKHPSKKSKGRSFGGRKDKMKEHVQNVHYKLSSRNRGKLLETDSDVDEEYNDDDDNDLQSQSKTQRQF